MMMTDHHAGKPATKRKRKINGVLLLDKAYGVSSNTALQQVRRLYGAEKAGHTGVLDPLATGLLPVCFGEATKFSSFLLDADKAYAATLKLGEATTTGDAEGEIIQTGPGTAPEAAVQAAFRAFSGTISQVPPMYSALKHQGKPLYAYARAGETVERLARQVTIFSIEEEAFEPPFLSIRVLCSKGTYIRTLAEDLARHMGTVAHLTALRRTAGAGFSVDDAYTAEALAQTHDEERDALLLPCDIMLRHLPQTVLPEEVVLRLQHGLTVPFPENYGTMSLLRVYKAGGSFVGLADAVPQQGVLKARRLMSTAGV